MSKQNEPKRVLGLRREIWALIVAAVVIMGGIKAAEVWHVSYGDPYPTTPEHFAELGATRGIIACDPETGNRMWINPSERGSDYWATYIHETTHEFQAKEMKLGCREYNIRKHYSLEQRMRWEVDGYCVQARWEDRVGVETLAHSRWRLNQQIPTEASGGAFRELDPQLVREEIEARCTRNSQHAWEDSLAAAVADSMRMRANQGSD